MIRSIDDIMYIVDSNNPFRLGLLYGRGGLGYKPNQYTIKGNSIIDDIIDDDSSVNSYNSSLKDFFGKEGEVIDWDFKKNEQYKEDLQHLLLNDIEAGFEELSNLEEETIEEYSDSDETEYSNEDLPIQNLQKEELKKEIEDENNILSMLNEDIDKLDLSTIQNIRNTIIKKRIVRKKNIKKIKKRGKNKKRVKVGKGYLLDLDSQIKELEPIVKRTGKYKKELSELFRLKYGTIKRMKGRMIGGMAERNTETGETETYLFELYNTNNWDELLKKIKEDENITDEEKINLLTNEIKDVAFINYDKNNTDDNDENKEIFLKIANSLINDYNLNDRYIKKYKEEGKEEGKNPPENNFYKYVFDTAKSNFPNDYNSKKGNIGEDYIKEYQPAQLTLLDNDNTKTYQTSDIEAYDNEFIDFLKNVLQRAGETDESRKNENTKKFIKDNLLDFLPFDIIKGKTIWEIKTYDDNNKPSQFQETKIKGWKKDKVFLSDIDDGKMSYKFIFTDDNKKVKNIKFSFSGKQVIGWNNGKKIYKPFDETFNLLKDNNKGYNYYWYLNNKSGSRYFSPLESAKIDKDYSELEKQFKNYDLDNVKDVDELIDKLIEKGIDDFNTLNKMEILYIQKKNNDLKNAIYKKDKEYIIDKKTSYNLPHSYTNLYGEEIKNNNKLIKKKDIFIKRKRKIY